MNQHVAIRSAAVGLAFLFTAVARGADERPVGEGNAHVEAATGRSAEDMAVDRSLDQVVAADLEGDTLNSLVAFLREHKIDALFDGEALDETGIDVETPLPATHIARISLRSLLGNLLRSVNAQYVIRNGKLFITTADKASSEMLTIVYRVDDLIRGKSRAGDDVDDPESLVNIITETIGPATWDEVGGPGRIAVSRITSSLMVSATQEAHEELARLLVDFRKLRTPPTQEAKSPHHARGGTEIISKAYPLSQQANAMQLLKEVRTIDPESWEQTGVHARAIGHQLIIRNTHHAHAKIEKALRARDALGGPIAGGGMGGGMF